MPASSSSSGESGDRVPGEYLVHLEPGSDARTVLDRAFGAYGLEEAERLEVEGVVYRIRLARDPGPEAIGERIEGNPEIRRAQPNFKYSVPEPPGAEGLSPAPAEREP